MMIPFIINFLEIKIINQEKEKLPLEGPKTKLAKLIF